METTSGKQLRCVVVTPERSVLDETAEFVALPLFDGELGVLPGRSAMIGRLGIGELRINAHGTTQRFFVDGGFVQVRSDVVTILTQKAIAAEAIDPAVARQQLTAAEATVPKSPAEQEARQKAEQRARAQARIAEKVQA